MTRKVTRMDRRRLQSTRKVLWSEANGYFNEPTVLDIISQYSISVIIQ